MTARSRYDGFPQVFLSGDKEKALAHLGRAKSLLSEVQRIREVTGTPVFQRALRTEDVEMIVKSLGETNAIYVHGFAHKEGRFKTSAFAYPVVLSGYIQSRLINPNTPDWGYVDFCRAKKEQRVWAEAMAEGRTPEPEEYELTEAELEEAKQPAGSFAPTPETVRAFPEYLDQPVAMLHTSNALRADTAGAYQMFNDMSEDGTTKYRAYRYVKGTWVTGTLSKCHQVVLGLHSESIKALQLEPPFLQEDQARAIKYAASGNRMALDSYVGMVQGASGFVGDYACSWDKSDGLVRGFKGWWLVRVQRNRILARRLPVFYGSDQPEYLQFYKDKGLLRLGEFIQEMGGLPTGESFGTEADIEEGISAGYVFDITPGNMPFAEGYGSPYEYCGWSFSDDGREAHNTALRYAAGQDTHYTRWATLFFTPQNVGGLERLSARVSINSDQEIFVPVRRMNRIDYQSIPLKVPYSYKGEVVSVELSTDEGRITERRKKVYNAVVWAGFIDGALHTVHYYYNAMVEARADMSGEPPPEDCAFGGSWEWEIDRGVLGLPPCVYSNIWDTRETLYAGGERSKLDSVKVGEAIIGGHISQAPEWSWYQPVATYRERVQEWVKGADDYVSAITVYPDRSAYVCASRLSRSRQERYKSVYRYKSLYGPWVGTGFRCFVRINSYSSACLTPGKSVNSYCNQVCNYMMGGVHQDTTDRFICYTAETQPGCYDLVETPPPPRCTDMTPYLRNSSSHPELPAMVIQDDIEVVNTFSGRVYNAEASKGFAYEVTPSQMYVDSGIIPRPSMDLYNQEYHRISSTRNCVGYTYTCFNINLLGTMGNGKIGVLHDGSTLSRTDITFVGLPER